MPVAGVPSQNSTQANPLQKRCTGGSLCLVVHRSARVQIKSYSIGGMYCQDICRRQHSTSLQPMRPHVLLASSSSLCAVPQDFRAHLDRDDCADKSMIAQHERDDLDSVSAAENSGDIVDADGAVAIALIVQRELR